MKVFCLKWIAFFITIVTLVDGRHAYPRAVTTESTTRMSTRSSTISSLSSSASILASNTIAANSSSTGTTSAASTTPTIDPSIFLNSTTNGSSLEIIEEPLVPVITPALSIAGVLLMVSGVVYAAIGVKHERILVFLSVAYLTALAITVLELFLITTPISSAIQGGYFVGVAVPALIVGALSLFFQDMLHGIGAPLGGFSLAMFILCMHDGGVLKSALAKAIFIGCWTVVCFGLQFVQCLRIYILIGSTSLAGATAIVLGIDCFSLAGLKEFWVFIWALNNHYFPDDNFVYPVSRGMIVQLAAIFVLTCFGILSQVRIWKVIKKQKDLRNEAKLEEHRRRDDFETELGRAITETQVREKREWERVYAEKKTARQSVREITIEDKHLGSISSGNDDSIGVAESLTDSGHGSDQQIDSTKLQHSQAVESVTPSTDSDPSTVTRPSSRTSTSYKTQSEVDEEAQEPTSKIAVFGQSAIKSETTHNEQDNGITVDPASAKNDPLAESSRRLKSTVDDPRRLSIMTTTSINAIVDENEDYRKRLSQLELPSAATSSKPSSICEEQFDQNSAANVSSYSSIAGSWPEENEDPHNKAKIESNHDVAYLAEEDEFYDAPESSVGAGIKEDIELITKGLSDPVPQLPKDMLSAISTSDDKIFTALASTDVENSANKTSVDLEAAPQQRPSNAIQQHRTGEWAKHVELGSTPEVDDASSAVVDDEPAAVPDEDDLLRTVSPAVPKVLPPSNIPIPISTDKNRLQIPNGGSQFINPSPQRSFAKRTSSAPNVIPGTISLPRNSDPKKVLKRQIQTPTSTNRRSVLASPIDEEAIASFPAAPTPDFHRRSNRASSLFRAQTEPTLIDTIQHRQSRASLPDAGGLPYINDQERPKSAILSNQGSIESIAQNRLSQNFSLPPQDFGRRASWHESNFVQNAPQIQVPEHTVHRASMLAEWRRSNSIEQLNQARTMSPTLGQTPNYSPGAPGLSQWQQQDNRRPVSQAGIMMNNPTLTGSPSYGSDFTMMNSNSGIPRYSSPTPRQSRPISIQDYENAHRDALRRMQAGANRALRTSGQY